MSANHAHEIQLSIRQAAANLRIAEKSEAAYEEKMKSAGANMYAAFSVAAQHAPEFEGRRIDDKAVARLYESTKARPWWDEHLSAAKFVDGKGFADRETAKRLIQWHIDPSAAQTRLAQRRIQQAAAQRKLRQRRTQDVRGMTSSAKSSPTTAHAAAIRSDSLELALAGRELSSLEKTAPAIRVEDLLGEVNRLSSASRKVKPEHRSLALDILRTAAREREELV